MTEPTARSVFFPFVILLFFLLHASKILAGSLEEGESIR